jgi:hypothetical protein
MGDGTLDAPCRTVAPGTNVIKPEKIQYFTPNTTSGFMEQAVS